MSAALPPSAPQRFLSYRLLFTLEPALQHRYAQAATSAARQQPFDAGQQLGLGEGLGQAVAARVVEELAH